MILLASIVGATAVGFLSLRYGAETRPVFDERPELFPHRTNI